MDVHDGHRKRLIQRFLDEGLDRFEPHNILELLLFYAIPRQDTNELAHRLIKTFGTLQGVLDAPYAELLKVKGVGPNTAALLKMIPQLARVYSCSAEKDICLDSSKKAGEYLKPQFVGRREEVLFLVCLDAKSKVLSTTMVSQGSVTATGVNIRNIINIVLQYNAAGVILAHNHPGGVALPSSEDLMVTHQLRDMLSHIGVALLDHIIVADQDYVSLAESGQV